MSQDQLTNKQIEEAWAKICPCCYDPLHDCHELNCRGRLCQWCECPHCEEARATALRGDTDGET